MFFSTARLHLRPLRHDDFDDLHALLSDERVVEKQDHGPYTAEQTMERLKQMTVGNTQDSNGFFGKQRTDFAIILKGTNAFIGTMSLIRGPDQPKVLFLGLSLLPSYWAQGYGMECATAAKEMAYMHPNVTFFVVECFPDNKAVIRICEKIGLNRKHSITAKIMGVDREILQFGLRL